jgi:hypothetical protein
MNTKIAIILGAGTMILVLAFLNRPNRTAPVPPAEPREPITAKRVFKPRLPAPRIAIPVSVSEPQPNDTPATNLLAWLLKDRHTLRLNRDQVEPYLGSNKRSAESLLAAFRVTADPALLREAVERYPQDAQVNCVASLAALKNSESPPEERRQRLDAFKASAPDNALANYLAALDCLRSGQTDQAVQELLAAGGKTKFQDYSAASIQSMEEAYRAAGYSEAEAKAAAGLQWPEALLVQLRSVLHGVADLASAYRQAGDEESAQAALRIGVTMGRQVADQSPQPFLVNDMVGLAIESAALAGMGDERPGFDPASPYDNAGRTVKDRLDELQQQAAAQKVLKTQAPDLLQQLSEQDLISFFDRKKALGEAEALRWAMNKQGNR